MDISSEENQNKIKLIKDKLDKDLLSNDVLKEYYKEGEEVIIRDDVDISSDDIFKDIKKNYFNKVGNIVHVMLHDNLVRIHVPNKKYDLYWNYKDIIPVKMLDLISEPNYEPKESEKVLESEKWYPYRIKTKEEFIRDYGSYRWGNGNGYDLTASFVSEMDFLFGQTYEFDVNTNIDDRSLPVINTPHRVFYVNWFMLTPSNPQASNYRPKKIERTLESNNRIGFRKVAIITENKEESDIVQKILFDNGYEWMSRRRETEIKNFNRYPTVLFAYINNMQITMMEMDLSRTYSIDNLDNLEKLKNGTYTDTYYKLFDMDTLSEYTNMIKYKKEIPSYRPRKIEKTLESRNNIDEAEEICIKFDNKEDLKKFEQLIVPYRMEFKITDGLHQSKIDNISTNRPIWVFINLDDYCITHLTLNEWRDDGKEPGDMTVPMCNGV